MTAKLPVFAAFAAFSPPVKLKELSPVNLHCAEQSINHLHTEISGDEKTMAKLDLAYQGEIVQTLVDAVVAAGGIGVQ